MYPKHFYLKTIDLEADNIIVEYDNYKASKLDTTLTLQRVFKTDYPNSENRDSLFSILIYRVGNDKVYESIQHKILNEESVNITLSLFEKGELSINAIIDNLKE